MNRCLRFAALGLLFVTSPASHGAQAKLDVLDSGLTPERVEQRSYGDYVRQCVDLLLEHGTDRYGKIQAPILVAILDVRTRQCPEDPLPLDEAWRVMRRGRRAPAGNNLYLDQPLLRVLHALSERTGEKRYAVFSDQYAAYVMKNLVDDKGFFWWGWHRHYDVFGDVMDGHSGSPHEIHIQQTVWPLLWRAGRDPVVREIESIWQWHVIDKDTGEVNRHGDGHRGCDFAMSAGEVLAAFAFLYQQTGKEEWLQRARKVADHHWQHRHLQTTLIPNRPNAGPNRFDGSHCDSSVPGLYCHSLWKAAEWSGDPLFRQRALEYLHAFARYAYDAEAKAFWGSLELDGTPVPGPHVRGGYEQYEPRGHTDLWQPYVAGYEKPLAAAQTYALVYQATRDPVLLDTARKWAESLRRAFPPNHCDEQTWYAIYARDWAPHGTYAEHYGRAISFLLTMHRATGEKGYLEFAREWAREGVARLYYQGLFRGHPVKPYYEAMDGVGYFLAALLDLDATLSGQPSSALVAENW